MKRLFVTLAMLLLAPLAGLRAADVPARPNIVVVLVDDMGFSDIGCYGSEIPTPNLDKLAAKGLRFTQFYNTGRCCPTRASLLTGLYPHQAGVGHMTEDQGEDGYRGDLNDRCVTIAEVLRSAGYRTAMTGKWHVTKFVAPRDETKKYNWPLQRGFDRYFGIIQGGADYFRPSPLTLQNESVPPGDGFYTTDAFADHAIQFTGQGEKTKPFFLYLAFNAPHFPLMASAEEIAKFRGKYKIGWDVLRQRRHARQIELGIMDKAWPLSPRPAAVKAWDSLSQDQQDRFDHIMAIYAAVVAHIDTAVGRLVDALRQRGELDNTLLFFLSDNGANAESGPNGRLEGAQPGATGSTVFEGQSWATLSNTPLRRYKHFNHEGGIATPLIVHWPAAIKTPGELRSQPGHLIDLMATCVDVARATYPQEFKGHAIQPMEGRSLVPAFANRPIERDALYWEHEGNRAVRIGKWKLVAAYPAGKWELYDMERDRTELHDLAAAKPDLFKALVAQWELWAHRTHAIPWPWRPPYGGRPENVGSRETVFRLKQGDNLPRERAPRVAGRSIEITAVISGNSDGVVVAQGGQRVGYSLYIKGGKLALATRHDGEQTIVAAPTNLPAGEVEISAELAHDGKITLRVAGSTVATGNAPGPLENMPGDGLQVGRDEHSPVGPYQAPFAYGGRIVRMQIQLGN
ncbi:MAG: arylsulfatase [Thermoguttaceae bacterium]